MKPHRPIAAWTRPIASALDARATPLTVFFRDGEVGWADDRLLRLLPLFEERQLPLDLAVIPTAISPKVAAQLSHRARVSNLLGLHQHGFAHENHETGSRRAEFGPSRDPRAQRADIEAGRQRLAAFFGSQLDPLFTPPWNRCTAATASMLVRSGIVGLSRDQLGGRLAVPGLIECPVTIDWTCTPRHRAGRAAWAVRCARAIADADGPFGILVHHLVTGEDEREQLATLLNLLRSHDQVRPMLMRLAAGSLEPARQRIPSLRLTLPVPLC